MDREVPRISEGGVSLLGGGEATVGAARLSWSKQDYSIALWLLKLGAFLNLYLLAKTFLLGEADLYILIPAQILFAVSIYRCLFPVRYEHDVVFHQSIFSSIFTTRLLATFAEVAWIFLFSYVLRLFNLNHAGWITALSWLMVVQVVISQCCVWSAILTERHQFYLYEESGWLLIFTANAIASAYLYLTVGSALGDKAALLLLNMVFGLAYMPFEILHLASLRAEMRRNGVWTTPISLPIPTRLALGLRRSMMVKNPRTNPEAWGGPVGLTWMFGYFATLIPLWLYYIVIVLSPR